MAIYNKYTSRARMSMMSNQAFWDTLRDMKGLVGKRVPVDEIYIFITRHTGGIADKRPWGMKARMGYFRYFVKSMANQGYIKQEGMGWRITEKVLEVK